MSFPFVAARVSHDDAGDAENVVSPSPCGRFLYSGEMHSPFRVLMRELAYDEDEDEQQQSRSLRMVCVLTTHNDQVYAVKVSENGRWVASSCYGNKGAANVAISSPMLGCRIATLCGHDGSGTCAAWGEGDRLLFTGGGISCHKVCVWATPLFRKEGEFEDGPGFRLLRKLEFDNGVRALGRMAMPSLSSSSSSNPRPFCLLVGKTNPTVIAHRIQEHPFDDAAAAAAAVDVQEIEQFAERKEKEHWTKIMAVSDCGLFAAVMREDDVLLLRSGARDDDVPRELQRLQFPCRKGLPKTGSYISGVAGLMFQQLADGRLFLCVAIDKRVDVFVLNIIEDSFVYAGSMRLPAELATTSHPTVAPFPLRPASDGALAMVLVYDDNKSKPEGDRIVVVHIDLQSLTILEDDGGGGGDVDRGDDEQQQEEMEEHEEVEEHEEGPAEAF